MKISEQVIINNEFEGLSRPKIIISNDFILISDPPFAKRIFLAFFCLSLGIGAAQFKMGDDRITAVLVSASLTIVFIYDALSLQRVKVDLQKRTIYRASLNPIENLINLILKRPSEVSFKQIDKIYCDYNEAFGGASQRYYLYIKTFDPYSLKICTFNKLADATSFAAFLNRKIK